MRLFLWVWGCWATLFVVIAALLSWAFAEPIGPDDFLVAGGVGAMAAALAVLAAWVRGSRGKTDD